MTDQKKKAQKFRELHVPGRPLVLYNIWDAGGAKALADAGAPAVATGSWSMAAAHGFTDGEAIPLDLLLTIVSRITATVDSPVTVDFEGGFAQTPAEIAGNVLRVIKAGAVGINFEDQVVNGLGLNTVEDQCARIAAIRKVAENAGVPLFINARTDVFLKAGEGSDPHDLMEDAIERRSAYAEAGADGFFVPGLTDLALIETICRDSPLPINVMMMGDLASISAVAEIGAARASFGPGPYFTAMSNLVEYQEKALAS
jgi:2-methylisocitrate lyase-like PEP mutase family enzyme